MPFWLALQFLTVLPCRKVNVLPTGALANSLYLFPAVGLVIGLMLALAGYSLSMALPPVVAAALLVAALAVLTGAHHLDGLADTCDGMVAGKSREERLALMAGKGVGAFGVAGVSLVLLLKFSAVYSALNWTTLLLMPVLARWITVGAIYLFPYAKPAGMGLVYKQGVRWHHLAVASVVALAVAVWTMSWAGAAIMAALAVLMLGTAFYLKSRLGGLTGDTYGAMIEVSEALVAVFIVAYKTAAGI